MMMTSVTLVTGSLESLINHGWPAPLEDESGVRNCSASDGSDVSYPEGGLEVLGLDGGQGFWFDHRFEAVLNLMKQRLSRVFGTSAQALDPWPFGWLKQESMWLLSSR